MTTAPEGDGNDRVRFKYNSEDPSPVSLPGSADATPAVIVPGDVVEVNANAAELMRDDEAMWAETDEAPTIPPTRAQMRAAAAEADKPKAAKKRVQSQGGGDQSTDQGSGDNTGSGE